MYTVPDVPVLLRSSLSLCQFHIKASAPVLERTSRLSQQELELEKQTRQGTRYPHS